MPTAADLDRVAQAARFTSVEAVRMHLRRVIERINQQGDRVIGYMDAGRTHDDYTQIVQQISELTGEALTLAAQLDVLASITRTIKENEMTNSVQWTGDNWEELITFVGDSGTVGPRDVHSLTTAEISTLNGTVTANPGDRIDRDAAGRISVRKAQP